MAVNYLIPDELKEMWAGARNYLGKGVQAVLDPRHMSEPPEFKGVSAKKPQSLVKMIVDAGIPPDVSDAYLMATINMTPGYIAANYRTPELIAELRRAMAAENKARGAVRGDYIYSKNPIPERTIALLDEADKAKAIAYNADVANFQRNPVLSPDPVDQILRGSWFHGMRPEARQSVFNNPKTTGDLEYLMNVPRQGDIGDSTLYSVLNSGLPGSTHAHPGYTRFGEPYGVSITASPSIAKSFSADDYINRVQPLYGGPPTERIIPMWRPEGQKVMNEGYNTAFNEFFQTPQMQDPLKVLAGDLGYFARPGVQNPDTTSTILNRFMGGLEQVTPRTGEFNTLYSKALQDKGYRGILHSPKRYGEYEMLMLDPSFVRPLDYRKVGEYINADKGLRSFIKGGGNPEYYGGNVQGFTPGSWKGYQGVHPELQTGATHLSDVFNQVPWVDRINEPNKRRIAELIDPQFREAVLNQLFGR